MTRIDISPKKTREWPTSPRREARHGPSEKRRRSRNDGASHASGWLLHSKPWRGRGEPGPRAPVLGTPNGAAAAEGAVPAARNVRSRIAEGSSNSTSRDLPQRIESKVSKRCSHSHVHSGVLARARTQKRAAPIDGSGQGKRGLSTRRNPLSLQTEVLSPAPYMDLTLSEKASQSQKDEYCVIPLVGGA